MKYIWIIMLAIVYLIWGVYSVKDFLYCIKTFKYPLDHCKESTEAFIYVSIVSISILFFVSLFAWVISKMK